ncbi:hypothetical protein V5O48_006901 [Marasmius crinis-equi]|uniref:Uncharacterized protein n=1 Tax=Marasmius crinis-equi TaxID=585013 RepID=A0ABR3FI89_9AGAR
MATSFYEQSALKWVNDIMKILEMNNSSVLDLVQQTIRHGSSVRNMQRHYHSLTTNAQHVLSLLEDAAPKSIYQYSTSVSEKLYAQELRDIIQKGEGLHFGARTATLEQMENFCLQDLASAMVERCPGLWRLLTVLLDVEDRRRKEPETEGMDGDDSDAEELESDENFAYSDSEDDSGSESEGLGEHRGGTEDVIMTDVSQMLQECGDAPTTKPKRRYRSQDRAARDRASNDTHQPNRLSCTLPINIAYFQRIDLAVTELVGHPGMNPLYTGSLLKREQ